MAGGNNPDSLNDAGQAFLQNYIRKRTRTYKSGWRQFASFCAGFGVDPQWAPLPLIVRFICNLYESGVSWSVVLKAISAISKYHIVDRNTGTFPGYNCQEGFLVT